MNNPLYILFSGSEVEVLLLKDELAENGITSMVRDDFQSGLKAGFFGGSPFMIDLYIDESDKDRAEVVLQEFKKAQNST